MLQPDDERKLADALQRLRALFQLALGADPIPDRDVIRRMVDEGCDAMLPPPEVLPFDISCVTTPAEREVGSLSFKVTATTPAAARLLEEAGIVPVVAHGE